MVKAANITSTMSKDSKRGGVLLESHDAIRKYTVELLEPITFGTIIDQLYAQDVIDTPVYEAATSPHHTTQEKGRKILLEVQKKVKANPKLFGVFCDILASNATTVDVSKRLRGK